MLDVLADLQLKLLNSVSRSTPDVNWNITEYPITNSRFELPCNSMSMNIYNLYSLYPPTPQLSSLFDSRATHARTLLPAALASVPFGFKLVGVRAGHFKLE
jgi:hypothetical protein